MSFPRYPKYKASGVEWLGEVLEHRQVTQGRRLFAQEREPPRPLSVIDAELKTVTDRILTMIGGLSK